MLQILIPLIALVAFLYASVGFGGATGYLLVMSRYDFTPEEMASTALILNIFVSGIAYFSFYKAGHRTGQLPVKFLLTSIPATFLGGFFHIQDEIYFILLYAVLTLVMLRMLFLSNLPAQETPTQPPSWPASLTVGALIGMLSGMVGIGGGILLSPLIILARWGTAHQAATVSAAFILINSISGLAGRYLGGNIVVSELTAWLLPFGILAAVAGSVLGARRLSSVWLQRALGVVMFIAVMNYWLETLR
jgi:uncharacterized membrane protein YfcA